jgi:UDP-N-acetylglucosamine--N-acetylmuramyl-(pentapeptide) pyrophosphoryl-undecaprenol N-acetylglucosamine transferase
MENREIEKKRTLDKKVVVTGGGSGGHISTASAIISTLKRNYELNDDNFLYIGGDLGMANEKPGNSLEQRIFANESFNKKYIRAGKLQRKFSLRGIFLLLRTLLGFIDSYRILKDFKPDIVLSTGGFVSVPVCLTAKLLKSKIYLHEQTAAVGLSNKIVSKYCEKIFVAFPSSKRYFPEEKTVHTGNLIRPEIFHKSGKGKIIEALKKMLVQQEDLPIIYISGGSLGSHMLNRTVKEALLSLLQDFQVILQTGDNKEFRDYELLVKEKKKLSPNLRDRFLPVKYIGKKEIGFVFNNIDFFVGRSGANTVYEMGVLQIPSIFIPIPWVTHNEQQENAKILEKLGLAEILNQGELTPENLVLKMRRFYEKEKDYDPSEVEEIFLKDAQEKILEEIGI